MSPDATAGAHFLLDTLDANDVAHSDEDVDGSIVTTLLEEFDFSTLVRITPSEHEGCVVMEPAEFFRAATTPLNYVVRKLADARECTVDDVITDVREVLEYLRDD